MASIVLSTVFYLSSSEIVLYLDVGITKYFFSCKTSTFFDIKSQELLHNCRRKCYNFIRRKNAVLFYASLTNYTPCYELKCFSFVISITCPSSEIRGSLCNYVTNTGQRGLYLGLSCSREPIYSGNNNYLIPC